jgi:hypothetical protein
MRQESHWIARRAIAQLISMRTKRIKQGDFSDFVEVTAGEKAAGQLNLDAKRSRTIPMAEVVEPVGVAYKDGSRSNSIYYVEWGEGLRRIIHRQAQLIEVFQHGPNPDPRTIQRPKKSGRAALVAVVSGNDQRPPRGAPARHQREISVPPAGREVDDADDGKDTTSP